MMPTFSAGIGRQIVHRGGEMLDQIMDDAFHGEDAHRNVIDHDGQMAVAPFFHAANGGAEHRVLRPRDGRLTWLLDRAAAQHLHEAV